MTARTESQVQRSRYSALMVGAGILLSRLVGLLRERCMAHYFGNSDAADVFRAALRIPNLLQNLLGEGALSASFIPVYTSLERKDKAEAVRVAGIVLSLLGVVTVLLVAIGMFWTPQLVTWITPGFAGVKQEAAIRLVRILFPGMGFLVLSAFCLGILNSHRRFFLPYAAPVVWSGCMIAALVFFEDENAFRFAENLAYGALAGSFLQFAIQLPSVVPLLGGIKASLHWRQANVREIIRLFIPSVVARGVVQLGSFIESIIASFLSTGAIASLGYAQLIYTLPTSLFGTSISASQLVELSAMNNHAEIARKLKQGSRQLLFLIVPSAVAFLCLGEVLASLLFLTGKFTSEDAQRVWYLLAASSFGLVASTQARLYSTTFFALQNTRIPLYCSLLRVLVSVVLALLFSLTLPQWVPGMSPAVLTAGIPFASSLAALCELLVLARALDKRIPLQSLPLSLKGKLSLSSLLAAVSALGIWLYLDRIANLSVWITASLSLLVFGLFYVALTYFFGIEECRDLLKKVKRRIF